MLTDALLIALLAGLAGVDLFDGLPHDLLSSVDFLL